MSESLVIRGNGGILHYRYDPSYFLSLFSINQTDPDLCDESADASEGDRTSSGTR